MIDWWNVFSQVLWIGGFALLLATFSYRSYQSSYGLQETGPGWLSRPAFFRRLGLLLVFAGLAMTSGTWIEKLAWGVLLCGTLIEGFVWIRHQRLDPPPAHVYHAHRDEDVV